MVAVRLSFLVRQEMTWHQQPTVTTMVAERSLCCSDAAQEKFPGETLDSFKSKRCQ
jgi:hypothetical protein